MTAAQMQHACGRRNRMGSVFAKALRAPDGWIAGSSPAMTTGTASIPLETALFDALENAHVVCDRRAPHVEDAAEPGVLHLDAAGRSGELHRRERMHRNAGCADRMPFG